MFGLGEKEIALFKTNVLKIFIVILIILLPGLFSISCDKGPRLETVPGEPYEYTTVPPVPSEGIPSNQVPVKIGVTTPTPPIMSGSSSTPTTRPMKTSNNSSWKLENLGSNQSVWLYNIWGNSPSDVFTVSAVGTILHYNGKTWSASGSTGQIPVALWGFSSSDVFAVGSGNGNNNILHFDGKTWNAMASSTSNNLLGVWGKSPSDLFAVGTGGAITHYDGKVWTTMTSPNSGSKYDLHAIWGSSSSDLFAVGVSSAMSSVILHYDGKEWSTMTLPANNVVNAYLLGVWGSSSSDVFAVGAGTILHYDGKAWSTMASDTTNSLNCVWGSSSSDVFAVGTGGTILHYDGKTWSTVVTFMVDGIPSSTTSSPNPFNGIPDDYKISLNGIWGSSSSDVFVVGASSQSYSASGIILHSQ